MDVYDLASYDCYDANHNGFMGNELDAGEYNFYVSRNAHDVADTFTCTLGGNVQYEVDPVTGAKVGNVFTGENAVDGVSLDASDEAEITWLSRAEARQFGVNGLYAPATNIHRSPFCARNYEYYSEDSFLSGTVAANTVKGMLESGTFVYVKHLVCDDADTYIFRDSIYTWMTEQTLREVYLTPFRMLVQEGGCTGVMSSYNRIGAVWAGGSTALLTNVLRGEWGFQGTVITDYADHHAYMNGDQMLRAGGDLWMDGWLSDGEFFCETESNSFQQALRRASKNIIYMTLNAEAVRADYIANGGDARYITEKTETISTWHMILAVVDGTVAVIAIVYFVLRARKMKRYRAQNNA